MLELPRSLMNVATNIILKYSFFMGHKVLFLSFDPQLMSKCETCIEALLPYSPTLNLVLINSFAYSSKCSCVSIYKALLLFEELYFYSQKLRPDTPHFPIYYRQNNKTFFVFTIKFSPTSFKPSSFISDYEKIIANQLNTYSLSVLNTMPASTI